MFNNERLILNKKRNAMETEHKKTHADFQDGYRRSSNFNNVIKKEDFNVEGDGELSMSAAAKKDQEEDQRIEDVMKSLKDN